MADIPGRLAVTLVFDDRVWAEEVERFGPNSRPRLSAVTARRELEHAGAGPGFQPCGSEGPDGTNLSGCMKVYLPLGRPSSSEAPYGFVFEAVMREPLTLELHLLAFGERHPRAGARSVYQRAHKRLHRRYPDQ